MGLLGGRDGDVYIRPLHSPESPTLLFSAPGITEVTFAFDRNMQVAVAYQVAGVVSLRWYDATVPGYVVTELPGIRNPKLTTTTSARLPAAAQM